MNRDEERARRREEQRQKDLASAVPVGATDAGPSVSGGSSNKDEGSSRTPPTQFLREVRSELRKVAWPTRNEVVNYTIVVLVVTLVLTLITFGMDFVLRELMLQVTS